MKKYQNNIYEIKYKEMKEDRIRFILYLRLLLQFRPFLDISTPRLLSTRLLGSLTN